jgi:hypothetical protein
MAAQTFHILAYMLLDALRQHNIGGLSLNMIELVLTVCALSHPELCQDQRIPFEADISLWQCAKNAPPQIARWAVDHPDWRVASWRCDYPGKHKKDI